MLKASENYVRKLIEDGMRVNERKFDEFREIKLETNVLKKAEGSASVFIGNTKVLVGVKMSTAEPFPDTPNEGVLIVNAELDPMASPTFDPGPPDPTSIELARVVDRGIRESKCIDLEKLCLEAGKKVWNINVDIHVLDYDGNLIDASSLGAIAALSVARIPKIVEDKIVFGEYEGKVPLRDMPVAITVTKISNKLLVDPDLQEEGALDARITITTNNKGDLCAIQKGGVGYFTTDEIKQAADLSIMKGKELRALIK
ncbi:MAG: exosome complex protein Rrp42 [Candidatus Aenigmatarchaeota archaeon]